MLTDARCHSARSIYILLQRKRLVALTNISAKTATAFQITGDVTAKMIVVTILMKKAAVSDF